MDEMLLVDELNELDVMENDNGSIFGEMEMEMSDYSELETYVMDMSELS